MIRLFVRLAAATLVAVLGAGIGTSLHRPASSIAQTQVLLTPLPGNAFSSTQGDTLVDLVTESQLPKSDAVLARVAEQVGVERPASLRGHVGVRLASGTDVMVISYRARTSARAAAGAVAVAEATLAERTTRVEAAIEAKHAWLDTAIGSAEVEIAAAYTAGDEASVAVLTRRLALLQSEESALDLVAVDPGEVLGTTARRDKLGQLVNRGLLGGGVLGGAALGWFAAGRLTGRPRLRFVPAPPRVLAP